MSVLLTQLASFGTLKAKLGFNPSPAKGPESFLSGDSVDAVSITKDEAVVCAGPLKRSKAFRRKGPASRPVVEASPATPTLVYTPATPASAPAAPIKRPRGFKCPRMRNG